MTGTSSSPCTHLLQSNEAPTEAEIPPIQLFISENQSRLDALDVQIDDLRAQMQRLQSERATVEDCIHSHRAVLSAVRRVPHELITEIFVWTLGGQTWFRPPWYLAFICRSWRGIALSTPCLWSFLLLGGTPPHSLARTSSILETLLYRSSNAPLDIMISCYAWDMYAAQLDMLSAHRNRWRTLRIHTQTCAKSPGIFNCRWLAGVKGQLSQLMTFEYITSEQSNEAADGKKDLHFLSVAPRLRRLFLTSPSTTIFSPQLLFPSTQITHYFAKSKAAVHREILSAAPNLVECILACGNSYKTSEPSLPTNGIVSLPRLRRLRVENSSILEHLSAPSLQHLVLQGNFDAAPSFVERSSCVLQQLMFTGRSNSPASTFLSLLLALPKLEHLISEMGQYLVADPPSITEVVRSGMTITDSPDDLLPNLKLLACFWSDDKSADEMESLWTMIESRHGPSSVHPLQTFRLLVEPWSSGWTKEAQNIINEFDGMDAKLLSGRDKQCFLDEHHGFPEYGFRWN
ncbi:hypothetical protein FB45DRAFT_1078799 [Roridomyces roridus]|uniref:F-box domain-containing protein n=1 Tax=Roridomyces roridus TaxID=1738132 RepID=A0AAD7CKU8_9AGAR|nr:hypothetical protein FB45DRAFT_1078799 [Roridomyces roridus]